MSFVRDVCGVVEEEVGDECLKKIFKLNSIV
jgi:hypothetical protein